MAMDTSHAATHDEKAFSVEILSGEEETTVVAEALRDFFEALDSAMDWVEREDPERTQSSSIGIFATSHGVREQVWAYPTEPGMHAAPETKRLVELFGFDPVAWKPPANAVDFARDRTSRREASRPGEHSAALDAVVAHQRSQVDPPADERPGVASPSPGERLDAWLRSGTALRLRQSFLAVWTDKVSRWCLLLGVICLWLTVTLLEPMFLVPLLAAAAALWSRRDHHVAPASDADDWF